MLLLIILCCRFACFFRQLISICYIKLYFTHSDDRNICLVNAFDIVQDAPKSFFSCWMFLQNWVLNQAIRNNLKEYFQVSDQIRCKIIHQVISLQYFVNTMKYYFLMVFRIDFLMKKLIFSRGASQSFQNYKTFHFHWLIMWTSI